jgi:hypothetical protein
MRELEERSKIWKKGTRSDMQQFVTFLLRKHKGRGLNYHVGRPFSENNMKYKFVMKATKL